MNDIIRHIQDPAVRENLRLAGKLKQAARHFLDRNGFEEYDTPVLMPKTGEWYNPLFGVTIDGDEASLADSPQLYKMMLRMAGCGPYYQFAHCFRPIELEQDSHTRLCEFTQIDVETQAQTLTELIGVAEALVRELCMAADVTPVITHMDGELCRDRYGSGMKPDLRRDHGEISVVLIEHMPLVNGEGSTGGCLIPSHHIFAQPSEDMRNMNEDSLMKMGTESFDMVINGIEVGGGDLRIMNRELQMKMMGVFGVDMDRYTGYLHMLGDDAGSRRTFGGGFAIGLERLTMALSGCADIRQTVCFPDFYKRSGC